jgi:mono/diheme cytochrome c family protein
MDRDPSPRARRALVAALLIVVVVIVLVFGLRSAADAQTAAPPDRHEMSPARRGEAIANVLCVRCHALGMTGASPHPQAPPFRDVARRYPPEHLAEALAEGLAVGHKDMPVITMSPGEIDAFLDYLEGLAESR